MQEQELLLFRKWEESPENRLNDSQEIFKQKKSSDVSQSP
jgi:hypothetical protein